jgi:hypothetical protein
MSNDIVRQYKNDLVRYLNTFPQDEKMKESPSRIKKIVCLLCSDKAIFYCYKCYKGGPIEELEDIIDWNSLV